MDGPILLYALLSGVVPPPVEGVFHTSLYYKLNTLGSRGMREKTSRRFVLASRFFGRHVFRPSGFLVASLLSSIAQAVGRLTSISFPAILNHG